MHMQHYDQYLHDLYRMHQEQSDEIRALKQQINDMQNTLGTLPGQGVEKIEYKFDQLKIENLNGTLHIGLSPENLEDIENLQAMKQNDGQQQNAGAMQKTLTEISNHLYRNGPQTIRSLAENYQYPVDQGYTALMLQDIEKQLPARISYHTEEARKNGVAKEEDIHQHVMEALKKRN
ncbi:spore germination protein GerPC [Virgibacillus halophilus]|uniref:Spore germination protein GerPC n=1 Tax=Tigheibacillus halophilus TaxID=361280 RepID=A0ABU5C9Q2_9BACI|nr:spore germination protein GerPC [Virgibacillus halophilus]